MPREQDPARPRPRPVQARNNPSKAAEALTGAPSPASHSAVSNESEAPPVADAEARPLKPLPTKKPRAKKMAAVSGDRLGPLELTQDERAWLVEHCSDAGERIRGDLTAEAREQEYRELWQRFSNNFARHSSGAATDTCEYDWESRVRGKSLAVLLDRQFFWRKFLKEHPPPSVVVPRRTK
ncbi:hypothetical protein CYLTODRAFT_459468 [Cylindrobasidium torrendii FP15055 ss-10]|uniref:Uncharacterized protein n=1 Tax=Cylindrobasidium torrendii FP15055 ss-10 TaxID=1314674 RepID=A0A0D7AVL1_9AGAR|nr:hypothetical protein CYLTODRAFT_459468 [Cylindrobasidium torrendii FP15055 ss-10]